MNAALAAHIPRALAGFLAILVVLAVCFFAGAHTERSKWRAKEAAAVTKATAVKRVTQAAGKAASLRTGGIYDANQADLRDDYAAARKRLRAKQARDARRLPHHNAATSIAAQAAGSDLVVVQAPCGHCAAILIDAAEEGDHYRLQVLAWQAWWAGQQEALAVGREAGQ